jgi:hypothetical protein
MRQRYSVRGSPVSSPKRSVWFFALAAIVFVGATSTSEAQGFRRGRSTRVVVVGGYYADPFWYGDPLYGFQYPWGPYGPYPYRGVYRLDPGAAVRLEVTPKEAEVYVDGYYAGVVDDFDGTFQRLRVEPGEHEIELYLDGYRPVKQKIYLTPDNTFKIKYTMEKVGAGEQVEPRPQPVNPPQPPQAGGPQAPMQQPQGPRTRGPAPRRMPPPPPQDPRAQGDPRGGPAASAYGTVAIRVQPADAEVSIDGDNWRAPSGQERLLIEVSEGSHTVEIRKAGFRTYVTQVEVRRGETTPLNVSLRGEQQ